MKDVIQIEIMKSFWKPDSFCIRVGDLKGSTEHSNISKEEILSIVEGEINELDKLEGEKA